MQPYNLPCVVNIRIEFPDEQIKENDLIMRVKYLTTEIISKMKSGLKHGNVQYLQQYADKTTSVIGIAHFETIIPAVIESETGEPSVFFIMARGTYKHFKGNVYFVHAVGRHSETNEEQVIYSPCDENNLPIMDTIWIRPLSMFADYCRVDGKLIRRFSPMFHINFMS